MKSIILSLAFCFVSASVWANPCKTNDDCPGSNNMCDQGECTVYGTGGCVTNDDCPGSDNICDQGTCWCAGSDCGQNGFANPIKNVSAVKALFMKASFHDLCETTGDCNGGRCTAAGTCVGGGMNAPCDHDDQCASGRCRLDGTCV